MDKESCTWFGLKSENWKPTHYFLYRAGQDSISPLESIYESLMRLLVDACETSLDDTEAAKLQDKKDEIEKLKANFCQEECEQVFQSGLSISRSMFLN